MLPLYLPARLRWRRDVAATMASLRTVDSAVEGCLARRMLAVLPCSALRRSAADLRGDVRRGELRSMADAELARPGLRRLAVGGASVR